ncbi:Transposable element Tc3 transposase [Phytophthora citrophthora]|uniref:Transposable element Tc3 transposase n=1 Tax=Phytophthora citrophthora TaxID=4793 RepID=A0AAD9LG93_9STRA|nr:Transposable element Tc3 transposase [Phytophthora citrophthora]
MGRGTALSDEEKGKIKGLYEAGFSEREIERRVGRARGAVHRVLFGVDKERKKPGPAAALTERQTRLLLRTAAKDDFSARQLKSELSLSASVRTIQRVLADVDRLIYTKMDNTLPLSAEDKVAREEWAWARIFNTDSCGPWDSIIFSDEKKWNHDGPDGFQIYWRDIRRPPRQTKRRQAGGGSVMVWEGFSAAGKTKLAVLYGKQNSDDYVYTMSEYLLPFAHLHYGTDFVYQQDGASIHRSKRTTEFLKEQDVRVLPWVARSPDLNQIENLWSIMSQGVYANGRQYSSVAELTTALFSTWDAIEHLTLLALIESMPRRCKKVIKKRGDKIDY